MSKHRKTARFTGMRLAIITYVTVLLLGFGGAAAHALWNMSGSATGTVVAGSWAPKSVDASTVTCSRSDKGSTSNITVSWAPVEADSYALALSGEGKNENVKTKEATHTFKLDRPGLFGSDNYKLSITSLLGSGSSAVSGTAANVDISVRLYTSGLGEVKCSAAK